MAFLTLSPESGKETWKHSSLPVLTMLLSGQSSPKNHSVCHAMVPLTFGCKAVLLETHFPAELPHKKTDPLIDKGLPGVLWDAGLLTYTTGEHFQQYTIPLSLSDIP